MIAYSASESNHLVLPDTWKSSLQLERWTGADFLVSPLSSIPVTQEKFIAKHLRAGALLVQRKENGDFSASVNDGRLADCICRMYEFEKKHDLRLKPTQRMLLKIGVFVGHDDDSLWINGKEQKGITYKQYSGAKGWWLKRGGVIDEISHPRFLFWWLLNNERQLQQIAQEPIKEFIPMPPELYDNGALQVPIRIRDGRRTLVTFPGVGPVTANQLWTESHGNLACAIQFLSDKKKQHEYLGLRTGDRLIIDKGFGEEEDE